MNIAEVAGKNPIVLAFIGDAYFTLFIRRMLVLRSNAKVGVLHDEQSALIKAEAQSAYFKSIASHLTETEADVARRARNAQTHSVPKHASLSDYKHATAFEAVIGFNYLVGDEKRIEELLNICL